MPTEKGEGTDDRGSLECLRPHEVAQRLGICRATVIRLMRKKKLPGFKLGGSWMTRRGELEAYLEGLARSARAAAEERRRAV